MTKFYPDGAPNDRHYINSLIGTPFKYGGRGPAEYDCFGLLKHLLARDGIHIRDYDSPTDQVEIAELYRRQMHLWEEVPYVSGEPYVITKHKGVEKRMGAPYGASVLYSVLNIGSHVGYVFAPNKFVHAWEGGSAGVCVEEIDRWAHRIMGVYRYVGPR
jgi:cell wall-associated NlpC family hydrolase